MIDPDTWLMAAIHLELKRLAGTNEDATRVAQLAMDNDVPFPPGTFRISNTIRITTEEAA